MKTVKTLKITFNDGTKQEAVDDFVEGLQELLFDYCMVASVEAGEEEVSEECKDA